MDIEQLKEFLEEQVEMHGVGFHQRKTDKHIMALYTQEEGDKLWFQSKDKGCLVAIGRPLDIESPLPGVFERLFMRERDGYFGAGKGRQPCWHAHERELAARAIEIYVSYIEWRDSKAKVAC